MKWSWKLGRVAGVDVRVHATFLILLAWVAAVHYFDGRSAAAALGGILFVLAVFGIVVLHELGHVLTARRFGIRTRDIVLLPIGGVSRLERTPDEPRQEFLLSIAGPAVNVALALLLLVPLLAGGWAGSAGTAFADTTPTVSGVLSRLFWVNVSLAVFNLIPAFPMDGGRALRALLAQRMDPVRATAIAARLGQGFALVLGAVGLFFNPLLVFIALFVWMGAAQEESASHLRAAIEDVAVRAAMISDVRTIGPDEPLREAVRHLLEGFQEDLPVVEDGRVSGVLAREDLLRTLGERGPDAAVRSAMRTGLVTAAPSEPLSAAFQRLQEGGFRTLPVVEDGRLLGVVTLDNVGELVMVRKALRERAARAAASAGTAASTSPSASASGPKGPGTMRPRPT